MGFFLSPFEPGDGKKICVKSDGLVKSPAIPQSGRVRVEPFEFTSNGGGGEALPRRVKRRNATFYEVIKSDYGYINTSGTA